MLGPLQNTGIGIPAACLAVTFLFIRPRYKSRLELQMYLRRYSVARILQNRCYRQFFIRSLMISVYFLELSMVEI